MVKSKGKIKQTHEDVCQEWNELLISIYFTPTTSHSCLNRWYITLSRHYILNLSFFVSISTAVWDEPGGLNAWVTTHCWCIRSWNLGPVHRSFSTFCSADIPVLHKQKGCCRNMILSWYQLMLITSQNDVSNDLVTVLFHFWVGRVRKKGVSIQVKHRGK